jgi:exonuclease SbcC
MLEKIRLEGFVSHMHTEVSFDEGVTVFIGRNGSGKSSIIDAVTFALYGEHTRGNNRNLVNRGSGVCMVQLNFRVDSTKYQAVRTLDASGSLTGAKLERLTDNGSEVLAHGERKQMGEAMSIESAKIIGLDYDRLRVAAIVQQGELDAILRSKPSEFKELINALIGIDKLDRAFEGMRDVIDEFRTALRQKFGYDDQDLEKVKEEMEQARKLAEESSMNIEGLNEDLRKLKDEEQKIKKEIDLLEPLSRKVEELDQNESYLLRYVKQHATEKKTKLHELEQLIARATKSMTEASKTSELESKLEEIRKRVSELRINVQKKDTEAGKMEGLLECAMKYLQPVDGKCPVCGSSVENLQIKLDSAHIKNDLESVKEELRKEKLELSRYEREEDMLKDGESAAKAAAQFLASVEIQSEDDLLSKEEEAQRMKEELIRIPTEMNNIKEPEQLAIDELSRELVEKIMLLRKEAADFDQEEFHDKKMKYEDLINGERPGLEREIGKYEGIRRQANEKIETLTKARKELERAHEYVSLLERIRKGVYNRDGYVAMSLRSWALNMISQKASDYMTMFALSLSRIELTEKTREIAITCYGSRGAIDMESLSGGEKVAVALALRLGMAYVMGRGKLDFIILDEPTTHLDEERRRSLVRIITEAFKSGLGPLSQVVIITHDAEIFEDANVDTIYKFAITADGTSVTKL